MQSPSSKMLISSLWLQVSLLTFAIGFAVLGYLAYRIQAEHPPIPRRVLGADGRTLFTGEDIMGGQHVFQRYGLMQYGTIFGHGAYLGPDFNAEYLHHAGLQMLERYSGSPHPTPQARARLIDECKTNRYDAATGDLAYSEGQVAAFGAHARLLHPLFRRHVATARAPSAAHRRPRRCPAVDGLFLLGGMGFGGHAAGH